MKKRILSSLVIVVIALVVLVYSMITTRQSQETGIYHKDGFGDSYKMYSLEDSEKVVYEINEAMFLLGERSEESTGTSYFSVFLDTDTWREPELLQVSSDYLVFSVKEGVNSEERKKIAIEVKETKGNFDDRVFHKCIEYDELKFYEKFNLMDITNVETIKNN